MKKIIFFLFICLGMLKAQTQDTSSVIFQYLPASVRIDSSYILLAESPSLAYKITWKNLQRSLDFTKLPHTTVSNPDDYFALTHVSGGLDTAKAIKASDLYFTLFRDSVQNSLGIATSEIYGYVDSTSNSLTAVIGLKTNIVTTDSLKNRLTTAEGSISVLTSQVGSLQSDYTNLQSAINLKANISKVDSIDNRLQTAESLLSLHSGYISDLSSDYSNLYSTVVLKANISTLDSLTNRVSTAESGIVANVNAIGAIEDDITTINSYLVLYAKKDSMISYINLSPESIKISASKITLDGDVVASSLTSKTITGATIQTNGGASGRLILNGAGNSLDFIQDMSVYSMQFSNTYGGFFFSGGAGFGGTVVASNLKIGTANVATQSYVTSQGYLTSESDPNIYSWARASTKPSYTYSEVGAAAASHTHTASAITDFNSAATNVTETILNNNTITLQYKDWSGANQSITIVTW
jgi:hypothetical protein